MQSSRNTIVLTRQRVGQIASYVVGLALVVAILVLIWTGPSTLFAAALIVLVIGLALWIGFAPRDFIAFVTGRQARFGLIAFLSTLLLIGIVALTYSLVQRQVRTFDLTVSQSFTLSPETQQVLSRLQRPVQITGFYTSRNLLLREIDDQFFRLYETAGSGLITRQYIDPDVAPAMAQAFGLGREDGAVFVSYLTADGLVDFSAVQRVPREVAGGNQERDMTEAILRLMIAGTITVYFDNSYQARDPLDDTQDGLSAIRSGMQGNGFNVLPLEVSRLALEGGDVPPDAAALLIMRPLSDYSETEVGIIDRYLDRGGGVMIAADVLYNENPFLQQAGILNQYLWANYGLRALDAAVVDLIASGQTPFDVFSARVYTGTVLQNLDPETNPALFRLARPVEVNLQAAPDNIANGLLVQTSDGAFGETNLALLGQTNTQVFDDGQDLRGPLTIAAWAQDVATNGRVVLIGDSDWVSNGMVGSYLGNGILFTESMTWLTGIAEDITFAPGFVTNVPLIALEPGQRNLILFIVIFLVPGVVLASGLVMWARRLRQ